MQTLYAEIEIIEKLKNDMILELQKNSHKGSILEFLDFNKIITEFEYHKAKLFLAIRVKNKEAIREYLADCANFLLSIGNYFNVYDSDALIDECYEINKEVELFKKINVKGSAKNQTLV